MKICTHLLLAGMLALPLAVLGQAAPGLPETHCLLLPLGLPQRAAQAAVVVEAEVLDARGFWDDAHRHIYTAHRVRVLSILKGEPPREVTVLTEGGTVGLDRHELTNTLRLRPGDQGVLFLVPVSFPGTNEAGTAWAAYGSEQGFIKYDLNTATAADSFHEYGRITDDFYQTLTAATGQSRRMEQPNSELEKAVRRLQAPPVAARGQAPVVSSLSPASIPAGTGAVLTIAGSGFGATRGQGFVEFANADNGGGSFIRPQDSEYVSWSDTRIQVRVPSLGRPASPAGSGPVRVTTTDQLQAASPTVLLVPYAISRVQPIQGNDLVRPNHLNQNGRGGYTFRLEAGFARNAPAVAAWNRALATWRCQTGMNWEADAQPRTGRGAAEDGENSIGFDQDSELPVNTLGRTTSYYRGCFGPNGELVFYVQEIDLQFDDAIAWQFGPAPAVGAQFDFESVAVHELGHAQQLAHVILPRAVMHYAISRAQNSRGISADDVAGGRLVLRTRSFVPQGCGPAAMLPAPLTELAAAATTGGVAVRWATRDECFLSGFEVQRSRGTDTTSWETLAAVAPAAPYQYLDRQPVRLAYYRLRLRRPDNTLDATLPVLVSTDAAALRPLVFPNPLTAGPLQLQYPATAAGRISVSLYDAIGRQLSTIVLDYQAGLNILSLPESGLKAGWYLLRYQDSDGREGGLPLVKGNP
jgi:hypothetical protein